MLENTTALLKNLGAINDLLLRLNRIFVFAYNSTFYYRQIHKKYLVLVYKEFTTIETNGFRFTILIFLQCIINQRMSGLLLNLIITITRNCFFTCVYYSFHNTNAINVKASIVNAIKTKYCIIINLVLCFIPLLYIKPGTVSSHQEIFTL